MFVFFSQRRNVPFIISHLLKQGKNQSVSNAREKFVFFFFFFFSQRRNVPFIISHLFEQGKNQSVINARGKLLLISSTRKSWVQTNPCQRKSNESEQVIGIMVQTRV